jgi:nucleoside-triphosphatase
VDVAALDEVVGDALRLDAGRDVFLVDEIGKMECCSARFVEAMETLLDSGLCVVATISDHGGGFIARTRSRADLALWRVTLENRDALTERVLAWIGRTPHTRGER